jgi:septal ring factor EnvC (AmiA/AmiB activator)
MRASYLITTLICFTLIPSARAVEKSSVEELAVRYQETKKNLVDSETEQRRILGSLYDINRRMKKIGKEKGHLTDELLHVQENVQSLAKVIADLEKQIDDQRHLLKARLRNLYKLSGEGTLSMVFSSSNSNDLDRSMKFLKIVSDLDYRLIRNYQKNVVTYRVQRHKLSTEVRRLVSIEKDIKKQEGLLLAEQNAKSKIATSLETSRKHALRDIKKIRASTASFLPSDATEEDTEAISGLLKPSFFEKKGQLPNPIEGEVAQDFGLVALDNNIRISHKGRQYKAPAGTPVSAVFEGKIAFSSWVPGYGNTIIIDHSDHYYTLYGHLGKSKVKVGQEVTKGQVIAEAGSTSRLYGDGIYFEIRHFSEPENPKVWIGNKGLPISQTENTSNTVELSREDHHDSQGL